MSSYRPAVPEMILVDRLVSFTSTVTTWLIEQLPGGETKLGSQFQGVHLWLHEQKSKVEDAVHFIVRKSESKQETEPHVTSWTSPVSLCDLLCPANTPSQ